MAWDGMRWVGSCLSMLGIGAGLKMAFLPACKTEGVVVGWKIEEVVAARAATQRDGCMMVGKDVRIEGQ